FSFLIFVHAGKASGQRNTEILFLHITIAWSKEETKLLYNIMHNVNFCLSLLNQFFFHDIAPPVSEYDLDVIILFIISVGWLTSLEHRNDI
ncbi:hypothetical protein ACJX0J_011035, partial [Zea mays]